MALVFMGSHGWGTLFIDPADIEAGVGLQSSFTNPADATAVTHYADDAGNSPSTGPVTADANGRLARWVEEGTYDQTLPGGAVLEVQAVSGSTVASVAEITDGSDPVISRGGLTIISTRKAINPRDSYYGAIGDGDIANAAADTAGLRAAFLDSFNLGRRIALGEGTFWFNANLGSVVGTGAGVAKPFWLEGDGHGRTIFKRTGDFRFIDITGNKGLSPSVTANVAVGDLSLTITAGGAATALITAGSRVIVSSAKNWEPLAGETTAKVGEPLRVKTVAAGGGAGGGDLLTFYGPIEEGYLTSDTPVVSKISPSVGVNVGGITFQHDNTGTLGALFIQYALTGDIDTQALNLPGTHLQLESCWDIDVRARSRDLSDNAGANQFGYGVNLAGASSDCRIDSDMDGGRHGFTTNGGALGVPRHCRIDVTGRNTTSSLCDTHEAGRSLTFRSVRGKGCAGTLKMRAKDCWVVSLHSADSTFDDVLIATTADNTLIENPVIRRAGNGGILSYGPGTRIHRPDIDGTGYEGIAFHNASGRVSGGGRIANPGTLGSRKDCILAGASGAMGGGDPSTYPGSSNIRITGRVHCASADYGVRQTTLGMVIEADVTGESIATSLRPDIIGQDGSGRVKALQIVAGLNASLADSLIVNETTAMMLQPFATTKHALVVRLISGQVNTGMALRIENSSSGLIGGIDGKGNLYFAHDNGWADADIAASTCTMRFDGTNGAAKVYFKGKSHDSTVKSLGLSLQPMTLAAAATDPATTQTLANSLRTTLIALLTTIT